MDTDTFCSKRKYNLKGRNKLKELLHKVLISLLCHLLLELQEYDHTFLLYKDHKLKITEGPCGRTAS